MPSLRLQWLPEALADFERLHAFLHEKSPDAAARAAQTLLDGARILETSSAVGRALDDDSGRRELLLPFGSGAYVLRYRVEPPTREPETIVIIRIWHSREDRR